MSAILTTPVTGAAAWDGRELARGDATWVYRFSGVALAEIDAALSTVKRAGLPPSAITREQFPLQNLARDLAAIARELEHGRGFVQMKGLALAGFDQADIEKIFWGLSAHLGRAISQNAKGELLGHVRDEGLNMASPNVRLYQTNARQRFHTDIGADVVGLMCLQPAKSGGVSKLASSMTVYNELLRRHPHHVGVLYDSFAYDWRGEQPPGESPVYHEPIYCYCDERLSCRFSPTLIESAQVKSGVALTPIRREAIRLMEEIAEEVCLDIEFAPGDIQYLSNYTTLHDRTAFVDHAEPERRRHLLRVWLTLPNGRRLPAEWANGRARAGVPAKALMA